MTTDPVFRQISITAGIDGDIVDNLDFTLRYKVTETAPETKTDTVRETPVEVPVVKVTPVVRKDTVKMVVHELVEELVTIDKDQWAIQLGAFKKRSNAEALQRKLKLLFGKNVEIVMADDFFKVRITEIMTREEVDAKIETLRRNGITELWLISLKAKTKLIMLRERSDTVARVQEVTDSITETRKKAPATLSIQVGAFRSKQYATSLRTKLSSLLNKPVEIYEEDGYYKVRVTGFENRIDMQRMFPVLSRMGFKDMWIPAVKLLEDDKAPVVIALDTVPDVALVTTDTLDREDIGKIDEKVVEKAEEDPALKAIALAKEPPVMLRVGEFIRQSQAMRAQRKIRSKLDVPTEIFEQWGYYSVVIKGFYTREETYKFYPELAALGYSKISLIEK
jgi:cell division protein FtsN